MLRSAGARTSSTFDAVNETSQPVELLLSVRRDGSRTLGGQIEAQLRRAIREGALRTCSEVPSTRDLARQLGISRRVAVDAYAQLAAEGYLVMRQGARPRVAPERAGVDAVVLTPAHQHPTGVVLSGERRTALRAWLRDRDAIAIEDDYDADYRYDRTAVGALQGLDGDRI